MQLSKKDWDNYIKKLSQINHKASNLVAEYVEKNGLDDVKALVDYSYGVASKYSLASASMNALMYDTIAELEGMILPAAELAPLPEYGDVAKAVQGTLKTSQNASEIGGAVGRLVKLTGQDTMLKNAIRDKAEFAWIPVGDTCAFCITLASRGWQQISVKSLRNGHAEHIHSNCDCSYMVRHSRDFDVSGYDPDKYYRMYEEGKNAPYENKDMSHPQGKQTASDKQINGMRRRFYQQNKKEILEQKASAYEKRKELNSSEAEETQA